MKTTITFLTISLLTLSTMQAITPEATKPTIPATTTTASAASESATSGSAISGQQRPTIKSIVDAEFKNGATALIDVLKKAGYINDAAALEKVKALLAAKNTKELTRQFKDGSLKSSFTAEMQTAAADKLPTGTFDLGKIADLKKHLEK